MDVSMTLPKPMTLEQVKIGESIRITRINDPETATMAMRLGVSEGEVLQLASRVPGGPVVIRRGALEIALGRDLCRQIEVESLA